MKRAKNGIDNSHVNSSAKRGNTSRERIPFARTTLYYCMAALITGTPLTAFAAPQGGEVVGGTGTISSSGTTTLIQQQTSSMVIDWQSFNVAADETVKFVQPGTTSVVLNRILDQNPSQIFGAIDANGRVFLSNPNGLVFGETATINAGSFVASGLDISADDFMAGNYRFGTAGIDGGAVINHGLIAAAEGGSVALVGSSVSNQGIILANYGTVNMGAGQTAVIDFDGDGLMTFQVAGAVLTNTTGATSAVDNQGEINALGGQILLTAAAAQDVFSRVINNDGLIEAGRIDNSGGIVRLVGIGQGQVINSGTIDVTGQDATSTGGRVEMLGDQVGLFGSGTIDASGQTGGGTILFGGDEQGLNPDITNASDVYLSSASSLRADALSNGDGGKVIVFATDSAQIYGNISAQGGSEGGNGGYVETSGKQYFALSNAPDVSAPQGTAGSWLIDPYNITIDGSTVQDISTTSPFISSAYTGTSSYLSVSTIQTALTNGATVTIETGGDSSVGGTGYIKWLANNDLNYTNKKSGTLNLLASDYINIASNIGANGGSDSLNVNLLAGGDVTVSGAIDTQGGTFTIKGIQLASDGSVDALASLGSGNNAYAGAVSLSLATIDTSAAILAVGSIDVSADTISGTSVLTSKTLTLDALNASNSSDAINLTNSGIVGNVYLNAASGNISYTQQNGAVTFAGVSTYDGDITLEDQGYDLTVAGTISTSSTTGSSNSITLTTSTVSSKSGSIILNRADGNSGSLVMSDGKVTLNSVVDIRSGTDTTNDAIDAPIVSLTADSGIGDIAGAAPIYINYTGTASVPYVLLSATTKTGQIYFDYLGTTDLSVTKATVTGTNGGDIALTSAGNMAINGVIDAGDSKTVSLLSTNGILSTGTSASFTASTVSLTGTDIGTSSANFLLDNSTSGATVGAVDATTGSVYLETSGDMLLNSNVSATTGTINLVSGGKLKTVAGSVVAFDSTMSKLSANGTINLNLSSNAVDLGDVTTSSGNITIADSGGGINVNGNISTTAGDITLSTTSYGDIVLTGNVTASSGNSLMLTSAGAINGSGTLKTGDTSGGITLNANNGIYNQATTDAWGNVTYDPINIYTSKIDLKNTGSGAISVNNTDPNDLTINTINVFNKCEVDISTGKKFNLLSSIQGAPELALVTRGASNIDWNSSGVYWATWGTPELVGTAAIDNTTLKLLSGLKLGTGGNITAEGIGVNTTSNINYLASPTTMTVSGSPLLDVGLSAAGNVTFNSYFWLSNGTYTYTFSGLPQDFNSITASSGKALSVNSNLKTETGDITLDAGTTLSIGNTTAIKTTLNSAKGITLAAASPLTLNGNFSVETSATGGNIDLSGLKIESSPSTAYTMSVTAVSGDIYLGTIGDINPIASISAQTAGTLYLGGSIYTTGAQGATAIDFGNTGQIVLKPVQTPTLSQTNITLSAYSSLINLGQNTTGTSPIATPMYSVDDNGTRYSLTINDPSGSVLLGPIGQTAPNLLNAQIEGWGALESLYVGNGSTTTGGTPTGTLASAVLYGNVNVQTDLDLQYALNTILSSPSVNLTATNVMLNNVNGQSTPASLSINSDATLLKGSVAVANNLDLSNSYATTTVGPVTLSSDSGSIILNNTISNLSSNPGLLTVKAQSGGVQLAGDVIIDTQGVNFDKTPISGTGALTIHANGGDVTLNKVGDTTNRVKSLLIDNNPSQVYLQGDIATRDGITITNTSAKISSNVALSSVDSKVDLTGTSVDGTNPDSYTLSISSGAGDVTLGTVGATNELYSLAVSSTGNTAVTGDIVTSSGIDMSSASIVKINNDATLYGQTIKLNGGTVDGPGGLNVYLQLGKTGAIGGSASFGQIGETTPLAYLNIYGDITSSTATFAGNINSIGAINLAQLYNVSFSGDSVVTTPELDLPNTVNASGNLDLTNAALVNFVDTTPTTSSGFGQSATVTATGTIATYGTVSSYGTLNFTSSAGSILLGDINLGTGNLNSFNATASAGDILNNRGLSAPANPLNNITANSIYLNASNRIGVSTTDPIVVYVTGKISLSFGSDMAYIRNMYGAPVYTLGDGVVIDVMRDSLLAAEKNISLLNNSDKNNSTDDDVDEEDNKENEVTKIITWLDNTRSPDVPRMIRTPRSWVFTRSNEYFVPAAVTVPPERAINQRWNKEGFKY